MNYGPNQCYSNFEVKNPTNYTFIPFTINSRHQFFITDGDLNSEFRNYDHFREWFYLEHNRAYLSSYSQNSIDVSNSRREYIHKNSLDKFQDITIIFYLNMHYPEVDCDNSTKRIINDALSKSKKKINSLSIFKIVKNDKIKATIITSPEMQFPIITNNLGNRIRSVKSFKSNCPELNEFFKYL